MLVASLAAKDPERAAILALLRHETISLDEAMREAVARTLVNRIVVTTEGEGRNQRAAIERSSTRSASLLGL